MRIAFLTPEYVTESNFDGGLANYLSRVAQGMQERGHDVEIFTASDKNGECIDSNGIRVNRVAVKGRPLFNSLNRLTRYKAKEIVNMLALSFYLKKELLKNHRQRPFDIVQPSSFLAVGFFSTFNNPMPIVTRVSSYEPLIREFDNKPVTQKQRIMEMFELISIKRSDAVYSPSRLLSNYLKENKHIKTDVLYPPLFIETKGLDKSIYDKYLSGKKYFLYFGTLKCLKGCAVIADCLRQLLEKYPDMYFSFAGEIARGPNEGSMLDYICEKAGKFQNRIIYLGTLKHSQLYPVILNAHAVVLPSLIDNLPNSMLEAMQLGKVVIGTYGASFDELIEDGISGILVTKGNAEILYKALEKAWNMSNEDLANIGRGAQERVKTLSSDLSCRGLEAYFTKLLAKDKNAKN